MVMDNGIIYTQCKSVIVDTLTKGGDKMRLWLSSLRKARGYTQKEMANKLSISVPAYTSIENGRRQKDMSLAVSCKLADVLGVPLELIKEMELDDV